MSRMNELGGKHDFELDSENGSENTGKKRKQNEQPGKKFIKKRKHRIWYLSWRWYKEEKQKD